jgi:AraC family transcriptional activator of mtrCDE
MTVMAQSLWIKPESRPQRMTTADAGGPENMAHRPPIDVNDEGLEQILRFLQVRPATFVASRIAAGRHKELVPRGTVSLHCCVSGAGSARSGHLMSASLMPGTFIVAPPGQCIRLGAADADVYLSDPRARRRLTVISAYMHVTCEALGNPFAFLEQPAVIDPSQGRPLLATMQHVMREVRNPGLGTEVLTSILLKQVLIVCFRALAGSRHAWLTHLAFSHDRNIARAYAAMASRPGDDHSVASLSQVASLSRSAFMARFANVVGCAPMAALRQLRMRRAADLLASKSLSLDHVARMVGYRSSSSFCRAFYSVLGREPRAPHPAQPEVHAYVDSGTYLQDPMQEHASDHEAAWP